MPPTSPGARLMAYRSFGVILADIIQASRLDAAMIFPVNKIPISTVIEGRGAQEMVALVLRRRIGPDFAHCTLITGGNRRWTC
jgi:hypothetical protein